MKEKIKKLFDNNTLHGKIMRAVFVLIIVAIICAIAYVIMKKTGFWEEINSMEKIREWVLSGGVFSFLIFILLQILQTTILQIPAIFVTIAGALIFGRWPAFIMSYIAVMIGSLIMFWIGRKAGRKFLNWLVGEETANKWIDRMSNGKYLFFLMMLFPLFPDDILCVVAGLTKMSFPFFFWTNILARGLGIACTVFFGSGAIIPFHGWGLIVWGILIVLVIILFYLSVKYKDKIDEIIKLMFKRKLKPANTVEDQEVLVNKQAVEDSKIEIEENKNVFHQLIENLQVSLKNPLTIRYYLANSVEFKQYRIKNASNIEEKRFYAGILMPKLVWIAEISTLRCYEMGFSFGEIVLDATASSRSKVDSIILIRMISNGVYRLPEESYSDFEGKFGGECENCNLSGLFEMYSNFRRTFGDLLQ